MTKNPATAAFDATKASDVKAEKWFKLMGMREVWKEEVTRARAKGPLAIVQNPTFGTSVYSVVTFLILNGFIDTPGNSKK